MGDRQVERLPKVRHLLAFGVAAEKRAVRLQQIERLMFDKFTEAPAAAFHLSRRNRNPDLTPERGERARIVLPERLLEP